MYLSRVITLAFFLVCRCVHLLPLQAAQTNYFEIDRNGDGYGIVDISLKGPDADDRDPQVNTPASILKKYSSSSAFLAALGYSP